MSTETTEKLLRDAEELARFVTTCSVSVASANREVTVTVGAGGALQLLEFGDGALSLDGRSLARLILDTVNTARARVEHRLTQRLGARADLLSGKLPVVEAELVPNDSGPKIPQLEQLRALIATNSAALARLEGELTHARTVVEAEGVKVLMRGTTLEALSIEDGTVSSDLPNLLLSVIRSASARAAQRLADQTVELTGTSLDVRGMVAAYASRFPR